MEKLIMDVRMGIGIGAVVLLFNLLHTYYFIYYYFSILFINNYINIIIIFFYKNPEQKNV